VLHNICAVEAVHAVCADAPRLRLELLAVRVAEVVTAGRARPCLYKDD
jgi:hypothetical protein